MLVVLALVGAASPVLAAETPKRLGLVGVRPTFHDAIAVALEPWNVQLVDVDGPLPSMAMPAAANDAERLTREHDIDAVAWLADHVLWLFDRQSGQLGSRQVVGDPDDEAVAAAFALTLKTLLRASAIAPPPEPVIVTRSVVVPPPAGRFWLEADSGVRLGVVENRLVAPRLGLAGAFWPSTLLGGRVGAFLRLEEGLGTEIHNREFRGRLSEHAVGLGLRAKVPLGEQLYAEPGVGGTLHVTLLDGAPFDRGGPIDVTRVDPSVDISAALRMPLGRNFDIGVRLTGAFWTRWQRYALDEGTTFDVSPIQTSAVVALAVRLD